MIDLRPNLYAVYHLNETSGDLVTDSSGNGRNGTRINMEDADWIVGKLNNALSFDVGAERVTFGNIANFERTDAFSLELWFSHSSVATMTIFSKADIIPNGLTGWLIQTIAGKIHFHLINNINGSNFLHIKTNNNYHDGTWHHLIITYNGNSDVNGVTIYIDNSLVAITNVFNALTGSILNNVDCQLSGRAGSNYPYTDGKADEVVIYDKELTQEEVSFRWNSGDGREDFFEKAVVTFNVKDMDGNHIYNFCVKQGEAEFCWKHSPFDLEIDGETTVCFDKGGCKRKSIVVASTPHTENVELEEVGRYTWRETL